MCIRDRRVADGRIAVGRGCERRHARASLHRNETDLPVRACAGQRGRVKDSEIAERGLGAACARASVGDGHRRCMC